MFALLRYYTLVSAVALAAVAAVLVVLYGQIAADEIVAVTEVQNVALTKALANTVWPRYAGYVAWAAGMDGDTLRARPETAAIQADLARLAAGLPVLKIKIYEPGGLTVYSSDPAQIGEGKAGNPGFMAAARDGVPASKLSYRETFSAFSGEMEDRDLVETYIPVKGPDGAVEGVFELYTDVTPMMARIARTTLRMAIGLLAIFGALYAVLALLVRRADRIIKGQYEDLLRSRAEIEERSAALAREMGEREKAQAGLRHAHDELEARVRERTEELRQATKMEAVGQMTGGVAHDFNNLLAVIQGNLEILDGRMGRDDERAAYVARAMAAAERGGALTRRLLTFARKQPIAPGLTDLNAVVVETTELFRRTLGAAVDVEIALAEDAPRTLVDRGELENALANVAINARDAMPGGGKLRIASAVVNVGEKDGAGSPPPGRYLTLTIRDTGTGMAPEVAARAFDPFFTTKGEGEGSGLGLSMVYRFTEQAGGHVEIESAAGRGTLVRMYLPAVEEGEGRFTASPPDE